MQIRRQLGWVVGGVTVVVLYYFLILQPQEPSRPEPELHDAYSQVSPPEVKNMLDRGEDVALLDVRRLDEYYGPLGHLPGARLIPVQELASRFRELEDIKDKDLIVYCRTGRRSTLAAEFLSERGYRILHMQGGMVAWNEMLQGEPTSLVPLNIPPQ